MRDHNRARGSACALRGRQRAGGRLVRDLAQPGLAKDLESLRAAKRKHLLDMQQRGYGPGGDSAALLAQSSDLVGGGA